MAALLAGMCSFGYAQDYLGNPKPFERIIGEVSADATHLTFEGGDYWACGTKQSWYETLLKKARHSFPEKKVDIRNLETGRQSKNFKEGIVDGPARGKVVENLEDSSYTIITQSINNSMRDVQEGSKVAIDQITGTTNIEMTKEDIEIIKDKLIDVLLDKGFKVVAKEYLQRLYDELKDQEDPTLWNPDTTVEGGNFSAVGYFINVKATGTSIRVQVINVSTGEYEGNATVNF